MGCVPVNRKSPSPQQTSQPVTLTPPISLQTSPPQNPSSMSPRQNINESNSKSDRIWDTVILEPSLDNGYLKKIVDSGQLPEDIFASISVKDVFKKPKERCTSLENIPMKKDALGKQKLRVFAPSSMRIVEASQKQ